MPTYTFKCSKHGEFEVRKPISEFSRTEPCLIFEGEDDDRQPCMEDSQLVLKAPPKEGIQIH